MNTRVALLVLLVVPALALAWGKKKEEAKPALPALKAGINHPCLKPLAEGNDAAGLIGMGMLDQTKGDLEAAEKKYTAAFGTGNDVTSASIDMTLTNGAIWIQSAKCPVPVPAAPASESTTVSKLKSDLQPTYPRALLSIRSEGVVKATVWVGADGRAARVHVSEASAGPSGIERRRDPGEEAAEKLVSRVQFALQAFEDLRAFDFGADKAGKSFDWKLSYLPPKDYTENLPGATPRESAASEGSVQGLGSTGSGK